MKAFAPFLLGVAVLPLMAQDQATTLLAQARSADVVVVARVTAATDPSPEWHRLEFTSTQVLKGNSPGDFAVLEPAGACCGRSLFALQVGELRVLFLRRRGPSWHPCGGARGVVPADPVVVNHIAALLAAPNDTALAHLLADNVAHQEARIADDAAHALAVLPQLALGSADRDHVAAALVDSVQRGTTRTAALAEVAMRVADDGMLDRVLPAYLDARRPDQARLLRAAMCRGDCDLVAARLPQFVADDQRALRAAELLVEMPTESARAALDGVLARTNPPRVALCVAEGLLAAGARSESLQNRVPPAVLELARARAERPRRFRAIDPSRR
jgi:hypothetical protein